MSGIEREDRRRRLERLLRLCSQALQRQAVNTSGTPMRQPPPLLLAPAGGGAWTGQNSPEHGKRYGK